MASKYAVEAIVDYRNTDKATMRRFWRNLIVAVVLAVVLGVAATALAEPALPESTPCWAVELLVHSGNAGREHEQFSILQRVDGTLVPASLERYYCTPVLGGFDKRCAEYWVDGVRLAHGVLHSTEQYCN